VRYIFKRPLRPAEVITAKDTWALRRECRKRLGLRKSARYRYQQIGCHSFYIRHPLGLVVATIYRSTDSVAP
jgi:hypothetical protein